MERYLLFDSGCSVCTELAEQIETLSEGRLAVRSLRDPRVQVWRTEALGPNPPSAPTLLAVEGEQVRGWTGFSMAGQLLWLLGPRKSWRVLQLLQEISQPSEIIPNSSRRRFLRSLGGASLAMFVLSGKKVTFAEGEEIENKQADLIQNAESKWYLKDKATAMAAIATASTYYENFHTDLMSNLRLDNKPLVLGKGTKDFASFSLVPELGQESGFFVTLSDSSTKQIEQAVACHIEDTSDGKNAKVWLNHRLVADVTLTEEGTIVRGWVINPEGKRIEADDRDYKGEGEALLDRFLYSIGSDLQSQPLSLGYNPYACLDTCLSSRGVAGWVLALIGILCAAACAVTVGTACWLCLGTMVGFAGSAIYDCLTSCGFEAP